MRIMRSEKKLAIIVLVILMVVSVSGCVKTGNEDGYVNSLFNASTMLDINENEEHSFVENSEADGVYNESTGLAVDYSEKMKEMVAQGKLNPVELGDLGYIFLYVPSDEVSTESATDESGIVTESATDETTNEYISSDDSSENQGINSDIFYYLAVYRVPENQDEEVHAYLEIINENFEKTEVIAELDGSVYYLAYNDDISALDYSDEDQQNVANLLTERVAIKNYICLFNTVEEPSINIGEFNAVSSDGTSVTQDVFSQYDLTMINIWSTNCEPCKEEMPELQELSENLPDNVNFLSLCIDGADDPDLTQNILDTLKCSFTVIYPDSNLSSLIQSEYSLVPTTIFVDKDGNVVGNPIEGAPSDNVLQTYQDAIHEHLDLLK